MQGRDWAAEPAWSRSGGLPSNAPELGFKGHQGLRRGLPLCACPRSAFRGNICPRSPLPSLWVPTAQPGALAFREDPKDRKNVEEKKEPICSEKPGLLCPNSAFSTPEGGNQCARTHLALHTRPPGSAEAAPGEFSGWSWCELVIFLCRGQMLPGRLRSLKAA